ncbi:hypothetical protein V6N13_108237 [Hibiscus sabdariffa]
MASSGPVHKLEVDVEIKASPEQFHDMFANKPHHVHHTCYDKIQGCELHEGEWGKVGTVVDWSYVHGMVYFTILFMLLSSVIINYSITSMTVCLDGKAKKAKEVIEAIDPDKNLITFRVIEGDLMEEYKSFVLTIQVSPKSEGSGSVVHWTLEYVKLHEEIDHPETLLEFVKDVSKDIDTHLTQQN